LLAGAIEAAGMLPASQALELPTYRIDMVW
jgi:hypothetical protein